MDEISHPRVAPPPRGLAAAAAALVLLLALAATGEKPPADPAEVERIAEALALAPGMRVADVGAGEGEWSVELARRVAPGGHVWATEIAEDDLAKIRARVREAGLGNVTPVLGGERSTGLPDGCCDAVLLRLVYHHFTHPRPMRRALARALRPGGRLVVVDIRPQTHWRKLPGVPERGGHGIEPDDLAAELAAAGFEVVARHDRWNGDEARYCLVFRYSGSG
jgi:ubiquinone/menaquinone biosynthesis C-methylase UbiE